MSLVDSLLGGRRSVTGSEGSLENPRTRLTVQSLLSLIGGGTRSLAGVHVTPKKAMGLTAVWRAVSLLSGTQAALPLHTYRTDAGGTRTRVQVRALLQPHPEMTAFELWEWALVSRHLWGNAYLQKAEDGFGIKHLLPLDPDCVRVGRVAPTALNPTGKVFEVRQDDQTYAWTSREVLHIPGLGYDGVCGASPIRVASQALGLGLAAEEYGARFFGNGSLLAGVLQTEQRLEQKDAEALHKRWTAKVAGLDKAHDVVVLGNGTKFQPIGIPPRDAAFLESRTFAVADAARLYGLPPHMLGETQKSTSYGSGIEHQGIQLVVYTLRPDLTRFEQRITRELCPTGVHAEYAVEGLLRGDSKARAAFYQSAIAGGGWMTRNEARAKENLPPLDGLDEPLVPSGAQTPAQLLDDEPAPTIDDDEDDPDA